MKVWHLYAFIIDSNQSPTSLVLAGVDAMTDNADLAICLQEEHLWSASAPAQPLVRLLHVACHACARQQLLSLHRAPLPKALLTVLPLR